ncbi:6,7-dimethyl-8-ribityllumazine synthase [Coxiella endosymbiont of Amblyomma sculptum]|uniref:6,7-dimethyl-8-ribityllumazine synthase n=1 Tax=Coxiella endosymbiont of Amblyomma sculptum TaxID=2487929 RepID=UPI00132EF75E|nr:6,7-dimethyl-8-ribityllumazine synthase [Coxiella endosymbiont of Amblyomma sculptum]QHG92353.1 6,7-dimethyl-8-ribityllumazine synthase [Coxiella endosymbiont of Amblyomma sculptum]
MINLPRLAIVASKFNQSITEKLLFGAFVRLTELGFEEHYIKKIWVPGVVEIPLMAKQLAKTGWYDVVVCFGVVIRGETDHYRYVCQQVSFGCQRVALEYEIPVVFGILTTHNQEQALARTGGRKGNKGVEMVDAAMMMVESIRQAKIR